MSSKIPQLVGPQTVYKSYCAIYVRKVCWALTALPPKNIGESIVFTLGRIQFGTGRIVGYLGVEHGAYFHCFEHINNPLYIPPTSRAGLVVSKKSQKLLVGLGKEIIGNRYWERG